MRNFRGNEEVGFRTYEIGGVRVTYEVYQQYIESWEEYRNRRTTCCEALIDNGVCCKCRKEIK